MALKSKELHVICSIFCYRPMAYREHCHYFAPNHKSWTITSCSKIYLPFSSKQIAKNELLQNGDVLKQKSYETFVLCHGQCIKHATCKLICTEYFILKLKIITTNKYWDSVSHSLCLKFIGWLINLWFVFSLFIVFVKLNYFIFIIFVTFTRRQLMDVGLEAGSWDGFCYHGNMDNCGLMLPLVVNIGTAPRPDFAISPS